MCLTDNAGTFNELRIRKYIDGRTYFQIRQNSVEYNSNLVAIPINTLFRAALSFKNGQLFGSINGVAVTFASVPPTINPMSILRIGSYGSGANVNNGMISGDNAYYYRSLNQDQLNIITAL